MAFQAQRTLSHNTSTSPNNPPTFIYPQAYSDTGAVTGTSAAIGISTDTFAYAQTLSRPTAPHMPVAATLADYRRVLMPLSLSAAALDPRTETRIADDRSTGDGTAGSCDGAGAGNGLGTDSGRRNSYTHTDTIRDAIVPVPVSVPVPLSAVASVHVPLSQPFAVSAPSRSSAIALSIPISGDESSDTSALIPGNVHDSENSEGSTYIVLPDSTDRTVLESDSARVGIFATFRAHGWRAARIYMVLALITYFLTFLAIYVTGAAGAALLIVAQVPLIGKPIAAKAEEYPEWIVPLSAHAVNQLWEPLRAAVTVALLRRS